ncbi:SRPBCC family protein [Streptomyces sp. NPDC088725]|uniref:SRPBCC family protein n=1 Tax=Streptomyces sp. NPDC088725 TaxID=3365873 RepID=UPI0038100591
MTAFRIDRTVLLPADVTWRRLTDWPAHADQVPLTTISVLTPGPTGVGTLFVARTALGRAGFDDPMEVVVWDPPAPGRPGHCRLEKRGRVLLGWAEIGVREEEDGRSRARWTEDLRIGRLPARFDPLLGPAIAGTGHAVFGRAVDRLLRG